VLGTALARCSDPTDPVATVVGRLQHELFVAQTELAVPPGGPAPAVRIEARHVQRLEQDLDLLTSRLPPLKTFVLSRGAAGAAEIHHARTVARRAERELWSLHRDAPLRPEILQWINRLSSLLFALALTSNHEHGIAETAPDYAT